MEKTKLGRTGLMVTRSSIGALPVQRLSVEEGAKLMRAAYEGGINFFDTARAYSDSEIKLGIAFEGLARDSYYIATKTMGTSVEIMREHLQQSLENLRTDYIDIYQLHNIKQVPLADSPIYQELLKMKAEGKIRHIGITQHSLEGAFIAARSGLYETIQFPLSCLASDEEMQLVKLCSELDIGLIGMKALAGGILPSAALSMAFFRDYPIVVPIWGIQKFEELEEIIALEKDPPRMEGEMLVRINEQRAQLSGSFCRGCGYCQPCAVDLPLQMMARMPWLIRRSPTKSYATDEWKQRMQQIDTCIDCGLCASRCPYHLDPAKLIREAQSDYFTYIAAYESKA